MPYHLTGDGHSIDEATVRAAFSDLVRTLDAATTDPDGQFSGRVWGEVWVGDDEEGREGFVLTSDEVRADDVPGLREALLQLVEKTYFTHHTPSSESGPEEWDATYEAPSPDAIRAALRALYPPVGVPTDPRHTFITGPDRVCTRCGMDSDETFGMESTDPRATYCPSEVPTIFEGMLG